MTAPNRYWYVGERPVPPPVETPQPGVPVVEREVVLVGWLVEDEARLAWAMSRNRVDRMVGFVSEVSPVELQRWLLHGNRLEAHALAQHVVVVDRSLTKPGPPVIPAGGAA